jgi:hypothetical protein
MLEEEVDSWEDEDAMVTEDRISLAKLEELVVGDIGLLFSALHPKIRKMTSN